MQTSMDNTQIPNINELMRNYDRMPYGILIVKTDPDEPYDGTMQPSHSIIYANPALMRLLAAETESANPQSQQNANEYLKILFENSDCHMFLNNILTGNGDFEQDVYFPAAAKTLHLSGFMYSMGYAAIVFTDVTDTSHYKEAAEKAVRANRLKTDFFTSISHDMRTPLNVIIGLCRLAEFSSTDRSHIMDCLIKIRGAGNHLLALINEVLDTSKVENGKIELNNHEFSFPELVDDIVLMTQSLASGKHLSFAFNQQNVVHENLSGDNNRLIQILLNIISNAVKYTPEGGNIDIDITECPTADNDTGIFRFAVKDSGIGMSPEFIEKIFEPYERENNAYVMNVTGTGLGMNITKKIVDLMGGSIRIESTEGAGSCFTVEVPMKYQIYQPKLPHFPYEKILVIDSSENGRRSILSVLDAIKITGSAASSIDEGLKALHEAARDGQPFTGVIIEYSLKNESGLAASEIIRAICGTKIKIIVVSSYACSSAHENSAKIGMDTFLTKPIFASQLAAALESISQKYDANSDTRAKKRTRYTGINVILAEDNAANAEIAAELLKYIGLNVTIAANGKDCVRIFSESEQGFFSCIFMDLQMPLLNGLEATRAIRLLNRPDANIPIFAMTGNVFTDDVRNAIEAGMQEHIAKPFELEKIERMLARWFPE